MKIQIIIGSIREGRSGKKVADWAMQELLTNSEIKDLAHFELIDLKDWDLPMFDEAVSPLSNKGIYTNPIGRKWADKIAEADGYIFVTPEYNHGYSAVLKNAIDWVNKEWSHKAVGFISYGSIAGGSRAVEQLRQVIVELQMASAKNSVHIPLIWSQFNNQGQLLDTHAPRNLEIMVKDLIWWTNALKSARENEKKG
jgi:NAD(P)H-dependent FMN reductase